MIPIRIEATNPGSIGAYKNTPFQHPIEPPKHEKPIKGSYTNWIDSKLTESKHALLEGANLSEEELIEAVVSEITQNPKYSYITYWIDNEVDDGRALELNSKELRAYIQYKLLPVAEKFYAGDLEDNQVISVSELCKLWRNQLQTLNDSLKKQYSGGEIDEED